MAAGPGYKAAAKILQKFAKNGKKTLFEPRRAVPKCTREPQAGPRPASMGLVPAEGWGGLDVTVTADIFLFEGFRLDRRDGGLFRRDERGVFAPVTIGARALDVLEVLVRQPGVLVSKDEIMEAVWPHATVENANLSIQISALRRVLDEGLHSDHRRARLSLCRSGNPGRGGK